METKAQILATEKVYLFTFSPKDITKNISFGYYEQLEKYFLDWKNCMKEFEINPECNLNGNLHYHGHFILSDEVKWYKSCLPKLKYNGFVKINQVKVDVQKALEYSRKDQKKMIEIIGDKEYVPYTHKSKIHSFKLCKIDKPVKKIEQKRDIYNLKESHYKKLTPEQLVHTRNIQQAFAKTGPKIKVTTGPTEDDTADAGSGASW